jgi:hypothetical protein
MQIIQLTFRTLQWLWAFPLTAVGLVIAALLYVHSLFWKKNRHFSEVDIRKSAILFIVYGDVTRWLLARHPFGPMDAMAIGCCVFACDEATLERTLPHELVHVRQAMQWGIVFPLAYVVCSLWCYLHGQCPYADNHFEIQARGEESSATLPQ